MKRFLTAMFAVTVMVPAALLFVVLWFNWGKAITLPVDDPRILAIELPMNRALWCGLPEALLGVFIGGALWAAWAALLSFWGVTREWKGALAQLQLDNRRLAAANRALENALPVLRERYDETIGALDPLAPAYNTPIGAEEPLGDDVTEPVDLKQLALDDALARQAS